MKAVQIAWSVISMALALSAPKALAAAGPTAETPFANVLYSATFNWDSTLKTDTPLRIEIGEAQAASRKPRRKTMLARILSTETGRSEALCTVTNVEKNGNQPVAMDLSCRGAKLGSLATHATVFWAGSQSSGFTQRFPMIRFGSWLQGYEHALLKVESDRYALSQSSARVASSR